MIRFARDVICVLLIGSSTLVLAGRRRCKRREPSFDLLLATLELTDNEGRTYGQESSERANGLGTALVLPRVRESSRKRKSRFRLLQKVPQYLSGSNRSGSLRIQEKRDLD